MSSPRSAQWAQLFALSDQSALPLQTRLRAAVVQSILDERLSPGAALPSSRELAVLLGLSRNTVTSAYLQLVDEGFLEARPRSGVFVAQDARPRSAMLADPLELTSPGGKPPAWSQRVRRSLADLPTLTKPE